MIRLNIVENDKKRFFETDKDKIVLGRSLDNDIMLKNTLSSRNHCSIEKRNNEFFLKDLNSRNGTRVNGKLIEQTRLKLGDVIQVGKVTSITVLSEQSAEFDSFENDEEIIDPGLQTRFFDAQPSEKDFLASKFNLVLHEEEKLVRLYEITKAINSQLNKEKLLERIMDSAIDLTKAERGCIVILGPNRSQQLEVARNIDRTDLKTTMFKVSQAVIDQVVESGIPMVTTNAQEDSRFAGSNSVRDQHLLSILCIPFKVKDHILGVLYLDHRFNEVRFSQADINFLEVFAEQAAIAIENARLYEEVQQKERLAFEIETASAIQQHLLPLHSPHFEGLEIVGIMSPASEMGGDYYDFIKLESDPNFLFICIGDVSGHGVAAGLVMVMMRSILHSLIPHNFTTKEILVQANKIAFAGVPKNMFLSVNLLCWNSSNKKLTYTSAGHEYLIHYHAKEKKVESIMAGGVVLGPMKDITSLIQQKELLLEEDDLLVLYTDGVTEAESEQGEHFSLERLQKIVHQGGHLSPQNLTDLIMEQLRKHIGKGDQEDDITLVVLKRTNQ